MKHKKMKIIMTSLLCAGIVSAASFAVMAKGNDKIENQTAKNNLSSILQTMNSESGFDIKFEMPDGEEIRKFIIDGNFPEGFELPEGAVEWRTSILNGERSGFNFGIGMGGMKGVFASESG